MPECPRCKRTIVDSAAIACPYCKNPLKAFGHKGIPLHQATDGSYLCDTCLYDKDDSCNYPKRPHAKECTMYHDAAVPILGDEPVPVSFAQRLNSWVKRNSTLMLFLGLILISLAIALF
ncbi:MAG: zinc ribbon domain-containing protein [Leptolyngbyaceae bacterium]|nr:zinc ribbon domain-containing protein [Leptolyngbyaceae bacterium]